MPSDEISKNQSIPRTCAAIDRVRLSRAATQHAIDRARRSLHETQALLVALRYSRFTFKEGEKRCSG
jgi:hypothetical protein